MDNLGNEAISEDLSPVHRMFEGRSMFITGASGFVGRVLLEKLLRTYRGLRTVYILLRSKKGQTPAERLHKQLLNVPIFDHIRSFGAEGERLLAKIRVVPGDISAPELGICSKDLRMLLEDESLSIVIHSAANIKFNTPLKTCIDLNLIGTQSIIELCRRLPNLISLCHVSSAGVNTNIKDGRPIEERLYPMRDDPEKLLHLSQLLEEQDMELLKSKFVGEYPNTYTYTKALCEQLIAKKATDLPVVVVRPSLVVAAWREPLPGWSDNIQGATGLVIALGKGLLRSGYVQRDYKADAVPVDVTANTIIGACYYIAKINNKLDCKVSSVQRTQNISRSVNAINGPQKDLQAIVASDGLKLEKKVTEGSSEEGSLAAKLPIFHCTSGDTNPITWAQMEERYFPLIRKYPSQWVYRYPFGSFKSNRYHDLFVRMFAHYLPAVIIDTLCVMLGQKPKLLAIYDKLHSAIEQMHFGAITSYNFKSENIEQLQASLSHPTDKRELYIDMRDLDWSEFAESFVLGVRRYVLKEKDHTLEKARRSLMRAYYIEIALRILMVLLFGACVSPLIARLVQN